MAKYHKPDSKLIHTPVEELCGSPHDLEQAPGVFDGERGLPGRTKGHDGVPEKVYDHIAPLPKGTEQK